MHGLKIAVLAVALALALPAGARAPDNLDTLRKRSLALVNGARAEAGLAGLEAGAALMAAAQAHADDMLARGYFSHEGPDGGTVQDRFAAAGGSASRLVAENIATCGNCPPPVPRAAVERLHEGWMDSPEHRANILRQGLSHYGFGVAVDAGGRRYAVQTFAGPATPRTGDADAAAIGPAEQAEHAAERVSRLREGSGAGPVAADPRLVEAAEAMLPAGDLGEAPLDDLGSLRDALPADAPWRRVQMIAGSCGGCGVRATAADVRFFVERWGKDSRYREALLAAGLDRIGLAIRADGRGRKVAVAVLAGGG